MNSTRHAVLFQELFVKPTKAVFDGEAQSSDSGAGLLRAVDLRRGLTDRLAALFEDRRDPSRVLHSWEELFRQRVFSIALGYSDQNDAARVGADPILKSVTGRAPVTGDDLSVIFWVGRTKDLATFGAEYTKWLAALDKPGSPEAKVNEKLNQCSTNQSRSGLLTQ